MLAAVPLLLAAAPLATQEVEILLGHGLHVGKRILLLSNLCKHLEAFLQEILLDDAQNLVLLQGLWVLNGFLDDLKLWVLNCLLHDSHL